MSRKPKEDESPHYPTLEEWASDKVAHDEWIKARGALPEDEPTYWGPLDTSSDLPWPWVAWGRYVIRRGRPVLREIRIVPAPDAPALMPFRPGELVLDIEPGGLTSAHLRAVKIRARSDGLREMAAWRLAQQGAHIDVDATLNPPRGRHARIPDDQVAVWANDYLAAVERSTDRRYRPLLLELWREREGYVTDTAVGERIRCARDRGFLSKARGKGDRDPAIATDKLRAWNEAHRPTDPKKKPRTKGKKR